MTQLEEVRKPWVWLWEWRKAMPRAISLANVSLKSQLRGICSFCSTSFRLPLGQYSVMMATLGGTSSNVIPMNLHKLGWSRDLITGKKNVSQLQWYHSSKYIIYSYCSMCVPDLHYFFSDTIVQCVIHNQVFSANSLYGHNAFIAVCKGNLAYTVQHWFWGT